MINKLNLNLNQTQDTIQVQDWPLEAKKIIAIMGAIILVVFSLFATGYLQAINYFQYNTYCWWFKQSYTWIEECVYCYVYPAAYSSLGWVCINGPGYTYKTWIQYECNTNAYSDPYNLPWCWFQPKPSVCYTNPYACPGIRAGYWPTNPISFILSNPITKNLLSIFGIQEANAQLANNATTMQQQMREHFAQLDNTNLQDFLRHQIPGAIFLDKAPPVLTLPPGVPAAAIAHPGDSPQVLSQKATLIQQFIQTHASQLKFSGTAAHVLGPQGSIVLPNGSSLLPQQNGQLVKVPTQIIK
jgi:hypothetical protein